MGTSAARKLTYDDFIHFPDDGRRHELIDGVHYVTPSPATVHQRLLGRLYGALHVYLQDHPVGEVFLSPLDILLSPHDVVEPDLFVVMQNQAAIVTEPNVVGAPAIVVEILSPATRRRDLGIKRQLFDRAGVQEYWVVDPAGRAVAVYLRGGDGILERRASLTAADSLTSPRLPGFSLALTKLFG
jgi:Uma2 family endonuclease